MKIEDCRTDFPITRDLIYLDSAATSLTPKPVVQAMVEYDLRYRANVGRGMHRLAVVATHRYRDARDAVRSFVGGDGGALAVTRNTTEAIGAVAAGLAWQRGDRVVTTLLEHHSNLLPWLRLRERGVAVDIVRPDSEGCLDLADLEAAIRDDTRLVAVTHASNVLGTVLPVREIAGICRDRGARLLVDGAQSAPHLPVDVAAIGCDYFCFSGHKMLGPTGTGALWMRRPDLEPLFVGGGSVESATAEGYILAPGEQRYEAGTPPIAGVIGLARAAAYLREIGMETVRRHEERLAARLIDGLAALDGVTVAGPDASGERIGVVSFTVEGMHPHEAAQVLDEAAAVLVRSGHHCCQPLMEHIGLPDGTVRASTYIYTTAEEVDTMIATVEEISRRAT
ncbi:cysteine desulfurase [Methanoculleus sp. Wushi-C6]|uniref:cysteine desulfurase n=1 Tax=Methanoculleus caldifontis TaxID=2651577 RepID=A0ABU3X2A7_9EURY|nr:cysteine desulfurase [Methanoculleus sp. Wushi-C6]MDV2482171.1 cysteine desulfurase [Methanoculleus sp. Wushi-C6]